MDRKKAFVGICNLLEDGKREPSIKVFCVENDQWLMGFDLKKHPNVPFMGGLPDVARYLVREYGIDYETKVNFEAPNSRKVKDALWSYVGLSELERKELKEAAQLYARTAED